MVINHNKQVFGTVEEPRKEATYQGLETNTAKVTVNNTERTIKVDVNYDGMLGETADKAYPGHLGVQTRNIAIQAENRVAEETERAINAENTLRREIRENNDQFIIADSELSTSIKEETQRAQAAEKTLLNNISELQKDIDTSVTDISSDILVVSNEFDNKLSQQKDEILGTIDRTKEELEFSNVTLSNTLSKKIETLSTKTSESIQDVNNNLSDNIQQIKEYIDKQDVVLSSDVSKLTEDITDMQSSLRQEITNTRNDLEYDIVAVDNKLTSKITSDVKTVNDNLYKKINDVDKELSTQILDNKTVLEKSLRDTNVRIYELSSNVESRYNSLEDSIEYNQVYLTQSYTQADKEIRDDLENVKTTYADKTYVHNKIVESTILSKRIVDYVDVCHNRIVIANQQYVPEDGILYLVKDSESVGSDIYKEYTTIDGNITLIGDTSTDLRDYYNIEQIDHIIESAIDLEANNRAYSDSILESKISDALITAKVHTNNSLRDLNNNTINPIKDRLVAVETNIEDVRSSVYTKDEIDKQMETVDGKIQSAIDQIPEVDLSPYATIEAVTESLNTKIDSATIEHTTEDNLTEGITIEGTHMSILIDTYTKTEVDDKVSSFISQIPSEYVTEKELEEKGYYNINNLTAFMMSIEFIDGGTASSIEE